MSDTMNDDERSFLLAVSTGASLGPADRAADRSRQWCRKAGYAEVLQNPRRWAITPAGLAALQAQKVNHE